MVVLLLKLAHNLGKSQVCLVFITRIQTQLTSVHISCKAKISGSYMAVEHVAQCNHEKICSFQYDFILNEQ